MSLEHAHLDTRPPVLAPTHFGRNRTLGILGAALFGLVVRAVTPQGVEASHGPPPYYPNCHGYGSCHCCNGSSCCQSGCGYTGWLGCESGGQCWASVDAGSCRTIWCCDYTSPDGNCICASTSPNC